MAGRTGKCPNCGKQFTVPYVEIELDEEREEPQFASHNTNYCYHCGQLVSSIAEICPACGVRHASIPSPAQAQEDGGRGLVPAGYICGILALLIVPPGLGLAGTVIGIINLTKGRTIHGIAQVVISVTCGLFGMIIGAAMWKD